jgi:hypothetical protein
MASSKKALPIPILIAALLLGLAAWWWTQEGEQTITVPPGDNLI